ncbi:MAG: ABC transporter ATP-binding protein/permease, partial [Burkholderiales bacterium]|nr:ABC transporter ATP-binding protein/permease [Burkholderiales bacterium]
DISEGSARLLGQPINAKDLSTRMRVGYMSQAFSLYEELSVRQNLDLHARLYRLEGTQATEAIADALTRFDLIDHADAKPAQLSLGIRQRLQLAAACLHHPEVLILDEPTSGVDPAARDLFWRQLIRLSRDEQVTIFVSTHFMNEAERCDRISLMHRGTVLAVGSPQTLRESQQADTLEAAFIAYLEKADDTVEAARQANDNTPASSTAIAHSVQQSGPADWLSRMWAFARRESMELKRDRIRLTFALLGPIILLVTAALAISFDIERINFAVLDHDQSYDSRQLIEHFDGSRYFHQRKPLTDPSQIDQRLRAKDVSLVIEIPAGYGRQLIAGLRPEVGLF